MRHGFHAKLLRALLIPGVVLFAAVDAKAYAAGAWPTNGVGICAGPGPQGRTGFVPDGSGGIYVTWQDARAVTQNIYALRINSMGQPAPGWPACGLRVCPSPGDQVNGTSVTDGNGGVIVLWNDSRTTPTRVYSQRLNGDGVAQWSTNGVPICAADSLQLFSRAISDGLGGAIVFWNDLRRAPPPQPPHFDPLYDLFCQRIDALGALAWDPAGVPACADSGSRVLGGSCIVADGSGGAIFVFVDNVRVGFYAQHLDGSGSRLWTPNGSLIPAIGGGPDVVADGAGGVWVATSDGRNGGFNVWVEHLDSLGHITSTPGGIQISNATNEQAIGDRFNSAASDDSGGVIVTWADTRNGHDRDIFAQRVLASGTIDPEWPVNGTPVCTARDVQMNPVIIADGFGGAIISWYDARSAGTSYDIYAQHITATGAIRPGWAQNGVALCTAPNNQVYPGIVTDGAGGATECWDDYRGPDVDIYAQRISSDGTVGTITTGVDLPISTLMLEAPRPNPATKEVLLSFSLPTLEPARVGLYDVQGREIRRIDVGSLGPGRHVVHFHDLELMGPGVYLVRLTQGARSLTRHIAVIR